MQGSRLDQLTKTSGYRLFRSLLLALASLYIVMIAINGIQYQGVGPSLIGFTLRSLKADMVDVISVESYRLFGFDFGIGSRPTRYALICEETGTAEADNVVAEQQVRGQLVDNKGGEMYNTMTAAIERGDNQPIFVLSKFARGGAKFCAANSYRRQECSCSGKYKASERSQIPASDLFGPRKPL
jgi:hypothetical protein